MKIVKYQKNNKIVWNNFLKKAKNGHFFFNRDYMEYHHDKFTDFSLIFLNEKDKVIALLPANIVKNTLYSHQGLTFGGLIVDYNMRTNSMLELFAVLKRYLKEQEIQHLIYKAIPSIYHKMYAQEDLYALFIHNAKLFRRDVTSTIDLRKPIKYSKGRKWTINRAKKENITLSLSTNYQEFWELLNDVLEEHHKATPIHTKEEMALLASSFNNNIKLYTAKKDNRLLSGAVIYENDEVVHTQYLANSRLGREVGALDLLIDHLIKERYKNKKFFDFGTSNEDNGRYLNRGLSAQKESFGARAVACDFYELEIS